MNPIISSSPDYTVVNTHLHSRTLFWGAIFAGLFAALAMQIVLMMLGAGIGLAMYNPLTNDNPIGDLGTGAAVIQGLTAVIALWVGGWVAGRFTGRAGMRAGALQGFMVWCLATVVAIGVASTSAGWALGDLSKMVGGGLSLAGKPAAAAVGGATDMAKDALDKSHSMLSSFVDEGLGARPAGRTPADTARAKREVGYAVTHLFTSDQSSMANNQQAVVTALTENQGMSEADARKMVDSWTASYQKLKSDLDAAKQQAETKARELADKTAKTLSILSLAAFVGYVIGAIFSIVGGRHGGAVAYKRAESDVVLN